MTRLTHSISLDTRLQTKNQLYSITIGSALAVGAALGYFFSQESLKFAIPIFFLFASSGTGYLFVAALILFEKQEHTLDALIVTPLRPNEYLSSKIISLSLLALLEIGMILIAAWIIWYGAADINWIWLILGVLFMQCMMTILGIIVVVRYDRINDFLMPTLLVAFVTQLPFLAGLNIWQPFFFYLIPTFPPFLLLLAAFNPIPIWQLAYGVIGSLIWTVLFYVWANRAFEKHIIQG
ncbi:MAG: fluoroquinolone transport system permease protein [Candidatus Promineifilaceae bacterium]|jgi:fluoroquinolone transport system permease protein